MNKFLFFPAAFFAAAALHAETADDVLKDIPPPKPPLLQKAPARSAWSIEIKPQGPGPVAPSLDPFLPKVYLKRQDWVKSGELMKCVSQWSNGQKTEDWVAGGVRFYRSPQDNGIRIFNAESNPSYHNFKLGDFEMLDWLTEGDYVEAIEYEGVPCYLFRARKLVADTDPTKIDRNMKTLADLHAPTSPTTVLIGIKTRLPVQITNGDGQYTFHFQSPPPGELVMPEPYASLWKAYRKGR